MGKKSITNFDIMSNKKEIFKLFQNLYLKGKSFLIIIDKSYFLNHTISKNALKMLPKQEEILNNFKTIFEYNFFRIIIDKNV